MTAPTAMPQLAPQRRQSELQPEAEAPLSNFDPKMWWQKRDAQRTDTIQKVQQKNRVSPLADVIGVDTYLDRLKPIAEIGQRALQGQIASSAYQAERNRAIAAAKAERERQAAYNAAMGAGGDAANALTGGDYLSGGGDVWGAGGAQGVANVLRAAGFNEQEVPIFMAIAKAESGWNPRAFNGSNRNGSTDAGLFQINSVHRGNSWYPTDVNDPLQSAKAAYAIYKMQGLKAWTVYNSGAYRQFLPTSVPPIQQFNTQVRTGNQAVSTGVGGIRLTAIQMATNYMNSGVRYVWGGNSLQRGVDCSGLVQQIYKQLGVNLPRTAQQQAFYGTKAPISALQPGDLVAWNNGGSRGLQIGHIAIYVGNGEIIESYQSGLPARRRKLSQNEINSGMAWGVKLNI